MRLSRLGWKASLVHGLISGRQPRQNGVSLRGHNPVSMSGLEQYNGHFSAFEPERTSASYPSSTVRPTSSPQKLVTPIAPAVHHKHRRQASQVTYGGQTVGCPAVTTAFDEIQAP